MYKCPGGLRPAASALLVFFPAKRGIFKSGAEGFETLTSAAQKRHDKLSRSCEIPANNYILSVVVFLAPQDIRLGCCSVAAHGARSTGLDSATF